MKIRRTPIGVQRVCVEATRVDEEAREWEDVVVDGLATGTTGRYRIAADGDGTLVHLEVETRAHRLGRLLTPLIERSSGPVLAAGFGHLKLILESAETPVPVRSGAPGG